MLRVSFRLVGAPEVGLSRPRGAAPRSWLGGRHPVDSTITLPKCPSSAVVVGCRAAGRRIGATTGSGPVQRDAATPGEGTSCGVSATKADIMRRRILIFGLPVLLTIPGVHLGTAGAGARP